jgi:DNA-binding CsgD family transcriptional regulator
MRWIVDLERVPSWQQNCWIEPIRAGIHGPGYFQTTNPAPMALIGARAPPEYGRVMVCQNGRMLAWAGVYVDARRGFRENERDALKSIAAQIAGPLRIAALLDSGQIRETLSPRQSEIMARLSLGRTNKQIAKDLDISPATVKTVIERLLRLSGAGNRAALASWWSVRSFGASPTKAIRGSEASSGS